MANTANTKRDSTPDEGSITRKLDAIVGALDRVRRGEGSNRDRVIAARVVRELGEEEGPKCGVGLRGFIGPAPARVVNMPALGGCPAMCKACACVGHRMAGVHGKWCEACGGKGWTP